MILLLSTSSTDLITASASRAGFRGDQSRGFSSMMCRLTDDYPIWW